MNSAVAFDIYGTLIDTQAVLTRLGELVGDKAPAVSQLWRQKQLEYSFRRGLMGDYCDFSVCTRQALLFACQQHQVAISTAAVEQAMLAYAELAAFSDVPAGLAVLQQQGIPLYAFSNGSRAAVQLLLDRAEIAQYFAAVVSVEDVQSFKPDPKVYAHLAHACGLPASQVRLVSSNPFDILGAAHAGLRTAWLRRDPQAIFDPWEVQPELTLENFSDVTSLLTPAQ
ncbi:MAG: haloacid dehalogenase type II [Gammaproteobacteria bacterium]|nr:haloacid dehalogenase type II [Gammaproteobacteria bacterium]MBU2155968.1 haloacid dehalogenase type II [Gammaproteobacteria bacterium]MBU2254497.1 haloacid dehalogenase type II [Gammaproteobacteria bacterium]MBU2292844.1 haloacid dehalogenase type II [Gammaproteobacteria bacterium]